MDRTRVFGIVAITILLILNLTVSNHWVTISVALLMIAVTIIHKGPSLLPK